MNKEQHTKLMEFLQVELAKPEGHACTQVQLVAAVNGFRGNTLGSWSREETPAFFEKISGIEDLTNKIRSIVEEHMDANGVDCRFVVTTFQHLGGKQHHQFKVRYDDGESLSGEISRNGELPGASGLVSQLMRHNDNLSKAFLQMISINGHMNARMLEELAADNARLRRERGDMYSQVENAHNHRMERELAVAAQAAQEERKDIAIRKLMEILPLVTQKLVSSGSGPVSAETHDQLSVAVNGLADLLTNEQVQKILPELSQEQQIAFFQVFQTAREAKAAAEKKGGTTAAPPTPPAPT